MEWADEHAHQLGLRSVSLIVSDANQDARRLYEHLGYREVASRAMVKERWQNDGKKWVLMIKDPHP
jgi:ribosomal protein S18 acetylase RimI-like enzyme